MRDVLGGVDDVLAGRHQACCDLDDVLAGRHQACCDLDDVLAGRHQACCDLPNLKSPHYPFKLSSFVDRPARYFDYLSNCPPRI